MKIRVFNQQETPDEKVNESFFYS